jgi:leucyl aminopeptidase
MIPIRLEKTTDIVQDLPAVILTGKTGNHSRLGFTEREIAYIRKKIESNEELVIVHSLDTVRCLVINDPSRPLPDQLEFLRRMSVKLQPVLINYDHDSLLVIDQSKNPEPVIALVEGMVLNNYRFDKYQSRKPDHGSSFPNRILVYSESLNKESLHRLSISCDAVYLSRNLVNEPLSHLNAEGLAREIGNMAEVAGFSVEVIDMEGIKNHNMGGLLAVNKGSVDPPTFTILKWKPDHFINEKPFVFIGKGIVFDTGGLSLKPTANSMDYMKSDMAGAAAVAGLFHALALSGLPVYAIGLIPATDNRPSGNAIVPGDIITMHDGTTVEVMNTDAEGRLLLADALSWAKQYDPELVIDLATLTGSASAAIGTQGSVAMQKSAEQWYQALEESGYYTHERLVRFPLWEEYAEMLKSDIADIKNIGGKNAGAITAGKFLEHFTSFPWIHLDIAGPAYLHTEESYRKKGGSGVGVRLLFDFLVKYSSKDRNYSVPAG